MSLTKFPFETETPQVDVTLPVGVHTLTLLVEDDAGMWSAPDSVVITIERIPRPEIERIAPDHGRKGETIEAVIFGKCLDAVTAIKVYRDVEEDERVRVEIRKDGSHERLPITIQISEHARSGPRTLAVTTESGTATVGFMVLPGEEVAIRNITPDRGQAGGRRPLPVRVEGDNLRRVTDLAFLRNGQPDAAIRATIGATTDDSLEAGVAISVNAEFGPRTLSVTTQGGATAAGALFTVLPGTLQLVIMALALLAALLHLLLPAALGALTVLPVLAAVGYLLLALAAYAPTAWLLSGARPVMRWVLLGYTLLAIVTWIAFGMPWRPWAYLLAVVQVLLIILLFVESQEH
jgi:hypothetical protein